MKPDMAPSRGAFFRRNLWTLLVFAFSLGALALGAAHWPHITDGVVTRGYLLLFVTVGLVCGMAVATMLRRKYLSGLKRQSSAPIEMRKVIAPQKQDFVVDYASLPRMLSVDTMASISEKLREYPALLKHGAAVFFVRSGEPEDLAMDFSDTLGMAGVKTDIKRECLSDYGALNGVFIMYRDDVLKPLVDMLVDTLSATGLVAHAVILPLSGEHAIEIYVAEK